MGRGVTVNGLWQAIVAAGSKTTGYALPLTGDPDLHLSLSPRESCA